MSDDLGDHRVARLAELLEELARSWEAGDRASVETYLERHAWLRDDEEATLELICHEMLLRQDCGETPSLAEVVRRFPAHVQPLKRFFAIQQMAESVMPNSPLAAVAAPTSK